ncbi:5'-methylthioadenosine/S-adenosylhomocysteine nucleosidase [Mesorhizobium sp. NBSH29]|uniref:5'-methylthioadenosine/S-adenosylhomocysteine nucleosidase n=1 Tax=Mesorhizobium sp. NBSH29 TaxID=2654249 RepID=UPI0018966D94|nr:5'-methylthioadenosine/S-adenosylhomocysteine nucleosidase [Mesorhizobium sp. NBSH29]QPC86954.1 5'-methylthioadenosine/S-adenosylhomocysteine nucleosidase [Mesorhizobium sp. NBSH29]
MFELKHVAGNKILYVMAADAEYGPHLKARFTPLITGVGPVEAAVAVAAELAILKAYASLPDLVVSLGSAGSSTLEQTKIYQAVSVSYRDMDASPLGFPKGATPFLDLPIALPLAYKVRGISEAHLSTGAGIVSGAGYGGIDADMVDMESFAVLRACHRFGVPLIALRGISDGTTDLTHIGSWTEYLHVIDEKLGSAVDALEADIASGALYLTGD